MLGPMIQLHEKAALLVIDVQRGFDDEARWGKRNNPACEDNIVLLLDAWERAGRPIVFMRHDSSSPSSPLRPDQPGNRFKPQIEGRRHDLLVTKSVHSSFHGAPDLHGWLQSRGISQLVITGIATNVCCETTARVGSDLGYDVLFAVDATHTFDFVHPDGGTVTADVLTRVAETILQAEFARVVRTAEAAAAAEGR